MGTDTKAMKGRATLSNPAVRFDKTRREPVDDGWDSEPEPVTSIVTELLPANARSIISHNNSPDLPFSQSINPYQGCEHGCVYCYARPTHAYLDLSPGLDFETRIRYKPNAVDLLEKELANPRYVCEPINFGANTDPYQPAEAKLRITRALLEVCERKSQPITIISKSALVTRDVDILQRMAARNLVHVLISVTTLDNELKRRLEPRTASGPARLRTVKELSDMGIPTGVLAAPMIPMINDRELETILEGAAAAGALTAGWILLRLPHELVELFKEWLACHFPERAEHVMSLIRQSRDGRENDPRFGSRMHGSGPYADLIAQRFRVAARRLGLDGNRWQELDSSQFASPRIAVTQLPLF